MASNESAQLHELYAPRVFHPPALDSGEVPVCLLFLDLLPGHAPQARFKVSSASVTALPPPSARQASGARAPHLHATAYARRQACRHAGTRTYEVARVAWSAAEHSWHPNQRTPLVPNTCTPLCLGRRPPGT